MCKQLSTGVMLLHTTILKTHSFVETCSDSYSALALAVRCCQAYLRRSSICCSAVHMHTHDGPQIKRRASNFDELMLEDLTVLTPCGERTLCKVSSTASQSSIAVSMASQIHNSIVALICWAPGQTCMRSRCWL